MKCLCLLADNSHEISSLTWFLKAATNFGGSLKISWASMQENLSSGFANNKGADQSEQLRSLINTIAIRLLESIISKLARSEISIF